MAMLDDCALAAMATGAQSLFGRRWRAILRRTSSRRKSGLPDLRQL
jgi:hypothetical protein